MQQRDLTLIVVAKNVEDAHLFDQTHIGAAELIVVVNYSQEPLSKIGNYWLEHSRRPIWGMCHADVVFGAGSLDKLCETVATGKVCGVVGFNPVLQYPQNYVWANKNPGPVSTLDSATIFVDRRWGIRFDDRTFDGFHLHVEDYCLQALAKGIRTVVPAADCYHAAADVNGKKWHDDWKVYRRRLDQKWPGVFFGVT